MQFHLWRLLATCACSLCPAQPAFGTEVQPRQGSPLKHTHHLCMGESPIFSAYKKAFTKGKWNWVLFLVFVIPYVLGIYVRKNSITQQNVGEPPGSALFSLLPIKLKHRATPGCTGQSLALVLSGWCWRGSANSASAHPVLTQLWHRSLSMAEISPQWVFLIYVCFKLRMDFSRETLEWSWPFICVQTKGFFCVNFGISLESFFYVPISWICLFKNCGKKIDVIFLKLFFRNSGERTK